MKRTRLSFPLLCTGICMLVWCLAVNTEARAQQDNEKPISFAKKLEIVVSNPLNLKRDREPVIITLDTIREKANDFNPNFFRVKYPALFFEPLDIPSQIRKAPGNSDREELVFLIDLAPNGKKAVELWYNPSGSEKPGYPLTTRSFEKWYKLGDNVAWENGVIAYRSYSGIVDFFAKAYPHLRLHDLPPDSYHHERFWGLDPYMVGSKPGLGGVLMIDGSDTVKVYGSAENSPLSFVHQATGEGPVCTEAVVNVVYNKKKKLEAHYVLYDGHHENDVTLVMAPGNGRPGGVILIAPGMQKIDGGTFIKDEQSGYFLTYGKPVEEYGVIATAFVWNPADMKGIMETDDGYFIRLKPDSKGVARYRSVAVWYRNSAQLPSSYKILESYVRDLARCFNSPVQVTIQ